MNSNWYIFFCILSFAFFVLDIGLMISWFVRPRILAKKNVLAVTRNTGRHLMIFSLFLFLSVWALRLSTDIWSLKDSSSPGLCRQFAGSFLHSLQTFSMDEDYDAYSKNGIDMLTDFFNGHLNWFHPFYVSVLNVFSPIIGGAFIFEILAGIFPQLRYALSALNFWKNRFYFTALNEQSLALAKNIMEAPLFKHIMIIFTDVYSDDENEESSEMLLRAKSMGAICLKDDLLHISLRKFSKKRTYIFLSDQEETINLQTLSRLLNSEKQKKLKNTEIRVFGTDKKVSNIEDEVVYLHNRLSAEYSEKGLSIEPDIAPYNGIRNMSQNLFSDVPLYEGLYGKSGKNKQLNLTIIGSGVIGTEMFLNAYWFGQMLDVELNINVISANEDEKDFVDRINGINPDIMKTSDPQSDILNVYYGEDKNNLNTKPQPCYFRFRFKKQDVLSCDLESFLNEGIGDGGFCLKNTDYFIVAVGSDEENFLIADRLRQAMGYYHLNEAKEHKTIINYVIYNSDLCSTLNLKARQNHISDAWPNEFDIYMNAFGCMDEIYGLSTVFRDAIRLKAEEKEKKNKKRRSAEKEEKKPDNTVFQQIRDRKYYNSRAEEARDIQIGYKVFCSDVPTPSLFFTENDEQYRKLTAEAKENFAKKVKSDDKDDKFLALENKLAWMEHRRWNAFMRINGFRNPDDMEKYIKLDSDVHSLKTDWKKRYQFLFIKRHPCIVESDKDGFPGIYCEDKKKKGTVANPVGPDELDALCKKLGTDYKRYDYPDQYV